MAAGSGHARKASLSLYTCCTVPLRHIEALAWKLKRGDDMVLLDGCHVRVVSFSHAEVFVDAPELKIPPTTSTAPSQHADLFRCSPENTNLLSAKILPILTQTVQTLMSTDTSKRHYIYTTQEWLFLWAEHHTPGDAYVVAGRPLVKNHCRINLGGALLCKWAQPIAACAAQYAERILAALAVGRALG